MSRARHKMHKKASGGGVTVRGGGNPNVMEEAEDKRRKRGGPVKHVGIEGKMAKMRLDKPGRKTGGRVGAEKTPLSGAHRDSGGTGVDTKGPFEAPK